MMSQLTYLSAGAKAGYLEFLWQHRKPPKKKDGQKLLLGQPGEVRTFFSWKRQDLASKPLVLKSDILGS